MGQRGPQSGLGRRVHNWLLSEPALMLLLFFE